MSTGAGVTRRDAGRIVAAAAALTAGGRAGRACAIRHDRARVEWRHDPIGIDSRRPRFRWTLAAAGARDRDLLQSAYRLRVSGHDGLVYDSGWIQAAAMHHRPEQDLPLVSQAGYRWSLALKDGEGVTGPEMVAGRFATGVLDGDDWQARWIAGIPLEPAIERAVEGRGVPAATPGPLPQFRHDIAIPRPVVSAILSIAGLGHYACTLNGLAVQPDGLASGWSDYDHTILYDSYDVTALVRPGDNRIEVMLGNGFFREAGLAGRYTKLIGGFGRPCLIARLRLVHADGSSPVIGSGEGWQVRPGPITFSSLYGGEDHDARAEARWDAAVAIAPPRGRLVANPAPPVVVPETLRPLATTTPRPGAQVLDFGVNVAARPRLTLRGARAGQVVRLWPAELLDPAHGTADQQSMTGADAPGHAGIVFTYVARGDPVETWEPQFSYTGFRYVEVEGATATQVTVEARMLRAACAPAGAFAASDPRLDRIHALIVRAIDGNLMSVPTDCPQREKLGWLEQTYLNAPALFANRDVTALYEKLARDMVDAQRGDGMVPSIAPEYIRFVDGDGRDTPFRDTPEWGSAIVLAPWAAYRACGDPAILRGAYPAMRRFVDYLDRRRIDGLLDHGLGDWYDIGPAPPGPAQLTTRAMTGTATLYADLEAMAGIAAVLGQAEEAAAYRARGDAVRAAILARLYDPAAARFDRGSQCAQAMGLALGLAPEADRPRVLAGLVDDIVRRGHHVSAGDIGFHYVVRALGDAARDDVLLAMMHCDDPPSYGAQIARGATALTEAWDGSRRSSQNHFMLGHIEHWFYRGIGGIVVDCADREAPIRIAPRFVAGLGWAAVRHRSAFGEIGVRWRRRGSRVHCSVQVPAGVEARIALPGRAPWTAGSGLHRVALDT